MSNDDREKAIRAVTDDLLTEQFTKELGTKARVAREKIENNDRLDQLREVIADVGRDLLVTGTAPQGMKYRGSLCVHVYSAETVNMAAFVTTSAFGSLDFSLADAGLRELTGSTHERFGRKRQKLRSGF